MHNIMIIRTTNSIIQFNYFIQDHNMIDLHLMTIECIFECMTILLNFSPNWTLVESSETCDKNLYCRFGDQS